MAEQEQQDHGQTEHQTAQLETRTRYEIRVEVFFPAAAIIIAFVLLGAVFTDTVADAFLATQDFITGMLGWFYILIVTFFLIFVIWLALSRYGRLRLGPDDSRPDYSYLSWFAMLFSAGMGIGLLFFSVAEPISHFALEVPPAVNAEPGSVIAAREAMNITYFHWGLHAWAIYIVVGLALGYFAYRRNLPLTLRSAFYPLLGDRIRGWMGDAIDTLAIVGTLFGVATSLGLGAFQINAGLTTLVNVSSTAMIQLAIIAIITAIATISVVSGLDKGILRLSIANLSLSFVLTLFVLIVGPTVFLLSSFVENIGYYVQTLPRTSLRTDAIAGDAWQSAWTLFYWGWWISWSPFVGMFIARISRGRTIREFIGGILLVPTLVTFFVLTVFGESAIFFEMFQGAGIAAVTEEELPLALFTLLDELPLATITSVVSIIVIATFFITSSDSGSLVDDIHASGGNTDPRVATRIFWALSEGSVAAILLVAGGATGLEAFQQASIATGIPLGILLVLICFAMVRALREEQRTVIDEREERSRLAERADEAREPAD